MKNLTHIFFLFVATLLSISLANNDLSGNEGKHKDVHQKIKKLQIPFIANEGQTDEQVKFYANTFGGTVFVTKDGKIVYALPKTEDREQRLEVGDQRNVPDLRQDRHAEQRHTEERHAELVSASPASFVSGQGSGSISASPSDVRCQETACKTQKPRDELHSPNMIHDNHESYIKSCRLGKTCPEPVEWMERTQQNNDLSDKNSKSAIQNAQSEIGGIALRETLVGAKIKEIKGEDNAVTKVNYFKGNDRKKWKAGIDTYNIVNLGEVYDGIELRLKAHGNNVEKLFTVKPGADPEQIKIKYELTPEKIPQVYQAKDEGIGTRDEEGEYRGLCENKIPPTGSKSCGLWINKNGELVAETALGPVKFTKPVAYQYIDGKRVDVDVGYVVQRSEQRHAEFISASPVSASEVSSGTACRALENREQTSEIRRHAYWYAEHLNGFPLNFFVNDRSNEGEIRGVSNSQTYNSSIQNSSTSQPDNYPTSQFTYGFKVGHYDKTKELIIDPLLASTYIGGNDYDEVYSIAVDGNGNVYVTGRRGSDDFPTTDKAYDTTDNADYGDVFISKLNSNLSELIASTFLGGSYSDSGNAITIDDSNNVYITGYTRSDDFPTTSEAYDNTYNYLDVFISKLNNDLSKLISSTFLGGEESYSYMGDSGNAVALDNSGNVYVAGSTGSNDFPSTSRSYDNTYNGDGEDYDVFISKLDGELTELTDSTFLGGNNMDSCNAITIDDSNNVYITGYTRSDDFPTTSEAYNNTYNNNRNTANEGDVYISKLNSSLSELMASTYLGGYNDDEGYDIKLDDSVNVYITGYTKSYDFPITNETFNNKLNGSQDGFISMLDNGLSELIASTFLGGNNMDSCKAIALDNSNNVYVTGKTSSEDFPTTNGAYDTDFNDGEDIFISKLEGTLSKLITSTFLGGYSSDIGYDLILNDNDGVCVTGVTYSHDFPINSKAYDTTYSYHDIFISKLDSNLSAPPSVTSTTPSDGETGVSADTTVSATFSRTMDGSTLNTDTFKLNTTEEEDVLGSVTTEDNVATFTPDSDLAYYTTYTATITTDAQSEVGTSLTSNESWSFTTEDAPPTPTPTPILSPTPTPTICLGPIISSTNPPDGATEVSVSTTISIAFSGQRQTDISGLNTETFKLSNNIGEEVSGSVTKKGLTATFTPDSDLAYNTKYTATITGGVVETIPGCSLDSYSWSFTTAGAPGTIAGMVTDAATEDPINDATVVVFDLIARQPITVEKTNSNGIYTIDNIPAGGPYAVVVTAVGYKNKVEFGVTVNAGGTTIVDISLIPVQQQR